MSEIVCQLSGGGMLVMSNQTSQGIILLLRVVGDLSVHLMLGSVLTGILCCFLESMSAAKL